MNTNRLYHPDDRNATPAMALPVMFRRHLLPSVSPTGVVVHGVRALEGAVHREIGAPVRMFGRSVVESRPYTRQHIASCYWRDAGWERRGDYLIGFYRAEGRSYHGSIRIEDSVVQPFRFHIYDPPDALLSGPHGACYRSEETSGGGNRYYVHFVEEPDSIDSGIAQIERNLVDAISND